MQLPQCNIHKLLFNCILVTNTLLLQLLKHDTNPVEQRHGTITVTESNILDDTHTYTHTHTVEQLEQLVIISPSVAASSPLCFQAEH